MKKYLALFVFLMMVVTRGLAVKDSTMSLSREQWREQTEDLNYDEDFVVPNSSEASNKTPATVNYGFNLGDYRYVFYFLVLVLVAFLTVRVIKNFTRNPDVPEKAVTIETIDEIEERIHDVDLHELLNQALAAKNYRIALRLNFLIIIKQLSQQGKIAWAKEKTNWEYYSELHDKLLADQFKGIIHSFENFWYGEHPLTEVQYQRFESDYHAIQRQLTVNE